MSVRRLSTTEVAQKLGIDQGNLQRLISRKADSVFPRSCAWGGRRFGSGPLGMWSAREKRSRSVAMGDKEK